MRPQPRSISTSVGTRHVSFSLLIAICAGIGHRSFAADIFVRDTYGTSLSPAQAAQITTMVKRSVRQMPEHQLVSSEELSDFVLQPSVRITNGERVLRIEKEQAGEVLALSENILPTGKAPHDAVINSTEVALEDPFELEEWPPLETVDLDRRAYENDSVSGTSFAGDLRAPSPIFSRRDPLGAFQIGFGPSFGSGLNADGVMYNLWLEYASPIDPLVSIKGFSDLNFASDDDANRFLNFGLGADFYPMAFEDIAGTLPYLTADVGFAFVRNKDSRSKDAPAVGAGGGFKFAASSLNMDLNLHYSVLTSELDDEYPSIFTARLAFNF